MQIGLDRNVNSDDVWSGLTSFRLIAMCNGCVVDIIIKEIVPCWGDRAEPCSGGWIAFHPGYFPLPRGWSMPAGSYRLYCVAATHQWRWNTHALFWHSLLQYFVLLHRLHFANCLVNSSHFPHW